MLLIKSKTKEDNNVYQRERNYSDVDDSLDIYIFSYMCMYK